MRYASNSVVVVVVVFSVSVHIAVSVSVSASVSACASVALALASQPVIRLGVRALIGAAWFCDSIFIRKSQIAKQTRASRAKPNSKPSAKLTGLAKFASGSRVRSDRIRIQPTDPIEGCARLGRHFESSLQVVTRTRLELELQLELKRLARMLLWLRPISLALLPVRIGSDPIESNSTESDRIESNRSGSKPIEPSNPNPPKPEADSSLSEWAQFTCSNAERRYEIAKLLDPQTFQYRFAVVRVSWFRTRSALFARNSAHNLESREIVSGPESAPKREFAGPKLN